MDTSDAGLGDLAELYGLLAKRLEQIVRVDVGAPDAVIEDACQFAWSRLVHHRQRVQRETVMGWLARTAVHEAFKLRRRDRRELSLDATSEQALAVATSCAPPEALAESRERLREVGRLPERQQRVLWLHALGLSYAEIADREGCTVRTVDRQLLRARKALRREDRRGSALG
jgi:RNA polymerase sigma factor (sigma-70 family)